MSENERYPVMVGLKLPRDLAAEIRRAAREDDRTVSGYLRRLLTKVIREQGCVSAEESR